MRWPRRALLPVGSRQRRCALLLRPEPCRRHRRHAGGGVLDGATAWPLVAYRTVIPGVTLERATAAADAAVRGGTFGCPPGYERAKPKWPAW